MIKLSWGTLLLVLALALSIGGLSWTGFMLVKQWDVNNKLRSQVAELKASQVMLMVPDDQAQQLSDWLGKNPDQVDELIDMARQKESLSVEIEPDTDIILAGENQSDSSVTSQIPPQGEVSVQRVSGQGDTLESVNDKGIKVIRLPHGGIRVTTREDNQ